MANELEFGLKGFDLITGATETGAWVAVQAVNGDAIFSAVTAIGDDQTSMTILDGGVTYGTFTSITVTSGVLKCYRNVDDNFDSQIIQD